MAFRVPVLGRLGVRDYVAVILGFLFMLLETVLRVCTYLLPSRVLKLFYDLSSRFVAKPAERTMMHVVQDAAGFTEIAEAFGYEAQEHIVETRDGYLLGLHRICQTKAELRVRKQASLSRKRGQRPPHVQKPVVYLHHGLMMNSEVWICNLEEDRQLPFVLVERGYDVWFGNNRGNKYSKKHINLKSNDVPFWDFGLDDYALRDIPDSISYILTTTKAPALSYIGFSQGTAQALAALSIHPVLNEQINLFVALAPAMSPRGLQNVLVDGLIKSSPTALFLFFGRKAILPSTIFWQSIIYPPLYVKILDSAMRFLFGWHSQNMSFQQKTASYYHLYSFASVKSLVHWFQVIRSSTFQMWDDETHTMYGKFYRAAKFPTKNISTPIVLMYGGADSLVDIDVMLNALPDHTIAEEVAHFEHLDFLWAREVDQLVIPRVVRWLSEYAEPIARSHQSIPKSLDSPDSRSDSGDTFDSDHSQARSPKHKRASPSISSRTNGSGGFVPKSSQPTTQLSDV